MRVLWPISASERRSTWAAAVIACAAASGMMPSRASTRASAASTSSIFCTKPRSSKTARISSLPKRPPSSSESAGLTLIASHLEEDGLAFALQYDVEAIGAALARDGSREQRLPRLGVGDLAQHRIELVLRRAVGEIDAGH